jgi:hypothetical protein
MRRGRFNAEGISIIVVAFTAACGADVHQQGSGKNPGVISHQQGSVKNPGVVAIPHALFDPSAADAIARGASCGEGRLLGRGRSGPQRRGRLRAQRWAALCDSRGRA